MKIHFLRHATLVLEIAGVKFLVDPMLGEKESMDPVKISRNSNRIPLTNLPVSGDELKKELTGINAVIVTHTHRDHWDEKARQLLPKTITLICQPTDVNTFNGQQFENLIPIDTHTEFKGLTIHRTGGQHGTGEIGKAMGHVSGFVIEHAGKKIYIAGDTIWCDEVKQAINTYSPDVIIVNAGAARFDAGDPITMTAEDVVSVCREAPHAKVVCVHMETVNHCDLTRAGLKGVLSTSSVLQQCLVPGDGERIDIKI